MASFSARLLALALRMFLRPRLVRDSPGAHRRSISPRQQRTPNGVQVQRISADGLPGEWVMPRGIVDGRVLYHLHGGGFFAGSSASERFLVARLARSTGRRALSIDYRLAPEHPFPAAIHDALQAYRWLVTQGVPPQQIVMSGSSAGGSIALATMISLRDAGDALPAGCVLLSPSTDLVYSPDSSSKTDARDPVLTRAYMDRATSLYVGNADRRDPLASPARADLRGLPPLLVHVGGDEIMLSGSTVLAERAGDAGVDVTLKVWPGMFHVFHAAGFLPESRRAMGEIGEWVSEKAR